MVARNDQAFPMCCNSQRKTVKNNPIRPVTDGILKENRRKPVERAANIMNYTDHSFIVGQSKTQEETPERLRFLGLPEDAVRIPNTGGKDTGVWLAPTRTTWVWNIYYKHPALEPKHCGTVSEGTEFLYNNFSDFPRVLDSVVASASKLEAGSYVMRSVIVNSHIYAGQIEDSTIMNSIVAFAVKSHVTNTVCVHRGQLWDSTVTDGWLSADVHHESWVSPVTFGGVYDHLVFLGDNGSWKLSQEYSRHANISIYGLKSFRYKDWLVGDIRKALHDDDMDTVVAAVEQSTPIIDKKALEDEITLPHGTVMPVDVCASHLEAAFSEYLRIVTETPNR